MNFNVRIQEEFKAGISYVECARIRVPVFVQVCIPECMRASVKRRENLKEMLGREVGGRFMFGNACKN